MKLRTLLLGITASALLGVPLAVVQAQDKEQFFPMLVYRTGPYAAGGTGFFGGIEDYYALLNIRDGGVGGIKLTWEECETAYNADRGVECYERLKSKGPTGGTVVQPLSTIAISIKNVAHRVMFCSGLFRLTITGDDYG